MWISASGFFCIATPQYSPDDEQFDWTNPWQHYIHWLIINIHEVSGQKKGSRQKQFQPFCVFASDVKRPVYTKIRAIRISYGNKINYRLHTIELGPQNGCKLMKRHGIQLFKAMDLPLRKTSVDDSGDCDCQQLSKSNLTHKPHLMFNKSTYLSLITMSRVI